MRSKSLLALLLVLALLIAGMGLYACSGDDDDDDDDNDTGDDDTGDDDTGDDDDDDDDDTVPGSIGGTVIDYFSENPIVGAQVEVLNNATGQPFDPPIIAFSGDGGYVSLTGIPDGEDEVGIKVSNANYKDTLQYYFAVGVMDETFLCISNTTVLAIEILLGVQLDPLKGTAAGAVYWGDAADETPIGCAEVTTDPANPGNVHYMSDLGMPSLDRDVTTPGDPQDGEGTHPNDGAFTSVNMEPGAVTITADADGNEASTVLPYLFPDSVCIVTIYYDKVDFPANPQGAWCTQK